MNRITSARRIGCFCLVLWTNLFLGIVVAQEAVPRSSPKAFQLSVHVRLPGTDVSSVSGLPNVIVSAEMGGTSTNATLTKKDGSCVLSLTAGWSGSVTPMKPGITFEPASVLISDLRSDSNVDFVALVGTFTISGSTGIPATHLRGFPGRGAYTDASGLYAVEVPYDWSGTVEPRKEDIQFQPPSRRYVSVKSDDPNQNYRPLGTVPISRQAPSQPEVMVVPTQEIHPDQIAAIAEDVGVMLHILKQTSRRDATDSVAGVFSDFGDFFPGQRPAFKALYLQGHGVLFFLEAAFDIVPEPTQEPHSSADGGQVDSVWQSARREMLTSQRPVPGAAPRASRHSADDVADDLMAALKHATNIRFLDAEETITIRVLKKDSTSMGGDLGRYGMGRTMNGEGYGGAGAFGGGGRLGGRGLGGEGGLLGGGGGYSTTMSSSEPRGVGDTPYGRSDLYGTEMRTMPPSAANTLTLHCQKSDVDSFARGKITLEEFKRRVKVLKY